MSQPIATAPIASCGPIAPPRPGVRPRSACRRIKRKREVTTGDDRQREMVVQPPRRQRRRRRRDARRVGAGDQPRGLVEPRLFGGGDEAGIAGGSLDDLTGWVVEFERAAVAPAEAGEDAALGGSGLNQLERDQTAQIPERPDDIASESEPESAPTS